MISKYQVLSCLQYVFTSDKTFMIIKNNSPSSLPSKAPKFFYVIIIISIILGIVVTPNLLISLGPMSKSLTSNIESVRNIAYLEVLLLRILFFFLSLLVTSITIYWRKIIDSGFIQAIDNHIPLINNRYSERFHIFNYSLYIIIGSIVFGILYIALAWHLLSPTQLRLINKEDGIFEYSTFILLLICCLLSVNLAFKLSGQYRRVLMCSFLALVFFVMAGEEISWGQRILNFNTPEIIQTVNVQGETNLHNLLGYFSDHLFMIIIFTWGCILPFLAYSNLFCRKLFSWIGIPIASPGLAIGFLLVSMFQRWILYGFLAEPPNFRVEELRELFSVIALTLLMYESLQMSRNNITNSSFKESRKA